MFPLTQTELGNQFQLNNVLRWGSLPEIFSLDESSRDETLRTYANTYLKEEIQTEQLVRKIAPFRSFLEIAAQSSGKQVNFSKIARDIGSDPVSVKSYFEILEDTLIGFFLPPFSRSLRKRQSKIPKFYFFDTGVQRALEKRLNIDIQPGTYEYGRLFEQWVILEVYRLNHYLKKDWTLTYFATKDGVEIDLVVERPGQRTALIEIKSTQKISTDDIRHIKKIGPDLPNSELFCFSNDPTTREINNVRCFHWIEGLREIGI